MPLTFKSKTRTSLLEHGLTERQADEVVRRVIENNVMVEFDRWEENPTDYPDGLFNFIFNIVRGEALKYIDEVIPAHFARMMFLPDPNDALSGNDVDGEPNSPENIRNVEY